MATEALPAEVACLTCAQQRKRAEMAVVDLENAEVTIRGLRREIGRLKAELAQQRVEDPLYEAAERVYEYWKERICPRSRAFGADRQKAVLARLNDDLTEAELKQAIEGCRWRMVNDPDGYGKHTDLELICRSEKKVFYFIGLYQQALKAQEQRKLERYREFWRQHYEDLADVYEIVTEEDLEGWINYSMELMTG